MDKYICGVVETIGQLADAAEASRWEVARCISMAFDEFPAYHKGLTLNLCARLKKSSDSIYGYKSAAVLQERLKAGDELSVSHFVALSDLQKRYMLTDETLKEWIERAQEDNLSVRDLRSEVAIEHSLDLKSHWRGKVRRLAKLMDRILQDAESAGVPESLYQQTKTAASVIQDLAVSVEKWKS
jgi:hypothetical protein